MECLLIRYIIHEKPYKSSYLWDTTLEYERFLRLQVYRVWNGIMLEKLQDMSLEPEVLMALKKNARAALTGRFFDEDHLPESAAEKIGLWKNNFMASGVDLQIAAFLEGAIVLGGNNSVPAYILPPGVLVPQMSMLRAVGQIDGILYSADVSLERLEVLAEQIRGFLAQSRFAMLDKKIFLVHVFLRSHEVREQAKDEKNTAKVNAVAGFLENLTDGAITEVSMDRFARQPVVFTSQWSRVADDALTSMERSDRAQETNGAKVVDGGIDLNGKNLALDVTREGKGIELKLDPAMVARFECGDFTGVVPVILKVTPLSSPLPLLGMSAGAANGV